MAGTRKDATAGVKTLDRLDERLAAQGEREAVRSLRSGDSWSFAELARASSALANGLIARGVEVNEPIVLLAPNEAEWPLAVLAMLRARAVPVPLDPLMGHEDLAHAIEDSGAERILTTGDRLDFLEEVLGDSLGRYDVALLDDSGRDDRPGWRSLCRDEPAEATPAEPEDRCVLFYTSGTTGPPKGVPLSHRNLASNLQALLDEALFGSRERVVTPLPLYHVYPFMIGLLAPLAAGSAVIFPAGLSGPQIVEALRAGEATALIGVPRLYDALFAGIRGRVARNRLAAALFDGLLASSTAVVRATGWRIGRVLFAPLRRKLGPDLRIVASGGAKLEPALAWRLEGLGFLVLSGYGLTETSPLVTFNPPGKARLETAGRPMDAVEVRIHEPDQQGTGEIWVRGPNVFSGYHKLPDKSAEVLDEEGWFHTGDRGRLVEGYLEVGARESELIVLGGGQNVVPERVEAELARHPALKEVAILERQNRLAALVVLDPGALSMDGSEELQEQVSQAVKAAGRALAGYARPSEVAVLRGALPRTPLGKLRRHLLPELFEEARQGRTPRRGRLRPEDEALLREDAAAQVWQWLRERYGEDAVDMDAHPQLDLGIDSLDWVTVTMELDERYGIQLPEETVGRVESVRDLLAAAVEARRGTTPGRATRLDPDALAAEQKRLLDPAGRPMTALAALLRGFNRLIMRSLFSLRVQGLEHLPRDRKVIFAPNHASYLDPMALAAALDRDRLRNTYWAGLPVLVFRLLRRLSGDRALRALQVLPIDPARAPTTALNLGLAALATDHDLVWFPEGQRSPDGKLQDFRPGVGHLARHAGVPLLPVHISGSFEAWPVGRLLPRPGRLTVRFGAPLEPESAEVPAAGAAETDSADGETAEALVSRLRERVAALGEAAEGRG